MEGFSLQAIVDLFRFGEHTHELHQSLLTLGMLIIVAKLAEGVFRRLRLNAIIAYAATGMLLGPVMELTGAWWIESSLHLELVLALGVFIFFFLIGLDEVDISSFMASLRGHYFLAAVLSVTVSLSISMLVTTDLVFDFGLKLNFTESLALAGVLSMTSLGIVAKVLTDGGIPETAGWTANFHGGDHRRVDCPAADRLQHRRTRPPSFACRHTDFAGQSGRFFGGDLGIVVAGVAAVGGAVAAGLIQVPQLSLGLLLGMLFLIVYGAEAVGLHGSLGALLFGASLSSLPYQVQRGDHPRDSQRGRGIFRAPVLCFRRIELQLYLRNLAAGGHGGVGADPIARQLHWRFHRRLRVPPRPFPYAVATGLMGKGVAEIALLLVMWNSGIIDEVVFSFLVLVMFCYILFMPSVISFAVSRASRRTDLPAQLDDIPLGIVRFALEDIKIDDILDRSRRHPAPSVTVRDFTEQWIVPHQPHYVVADKEALVGVVSLEMLRYLPKDAWGKTQLDAVVRRQTPLAYPDEQVEDVLHRMSENSLSVMPVVERDSEKFLGAVTNSDIIQLMTMETMGESRSLHRPVRSRQNH